MKGEEIMLKIAHIREIEAVRGLPSEVIDVVRDAVIILDTEYGESRDVDNGYGGYVLVIMEEEEIEKLKDVFINIDTVIPEYVDIFGCNYGMGFASSLILLGSDFGVILIMPKNVLPEHWKPYIKNEDL